MPSVDVVIVGAGPAGIGMALALESVPGLEYKVLESHRVGESFRRWRLAVIPSTDRRLHVLHVTTAEEMTFLAPPGQDDPLSGNTR